MKQTINLNRVEKKDSELRWKCKLIFRRGQSRKKGTFQRERKNCIKENRGGWETLGQSHSLGEVSMAGLMEETGPK